MTKSDTPYLYENTHTDTVEDHLLIYVPLSKKGLTVLTNAAAYLFKLIDNKKTLGDIYESAKKIDPRLTFAQINKIFEEFYNLDIVYVNQPKLKKEGIFEKSKVLAIWFHITNQCNLRCTYCFVKKTPEKMTKEIAEQSIKKILNDGKKNGYSEIRVFFSGGECLLELGLLLHTVEIGRALAKELNIKVGFSISTNGTLITRENARILKENHITVGVSLDGLENSNDKQRIYRNGSGTFKHVLRGIKHLQSEKTSFNVMVTITANNVKDLPKLVKYFFKENIHFRLNFFQENLYSPDKLKADNKVMISYLKKTYKYIYDNIPNYYIINDLLDRVSFMTPRLSACAIGKDYMTITQDGKVSSCPMTLKRIIGSVNDTDIIQTMKNGTFVTPKNLTVEGKKTCNQCQWKYICCGGCPLLTSAHKGTYEANSPNCEIYKALIPEAFKLEAKRLIRYGLQH